MSRTCETVLSLQRRGGEPVPEGSSVPLKGGDRLANRIQKKHFFNESWELGTAKAAKLLLLPGT